MCLLLGPPGSGKSSLLKILAGKIRGSKLVQVSSLTVCHSWHSSVHSSTNFASQQLSRFVPVHMPPSLVRVSRTVGKQVHACLA